MKNHSSHEQIKTINHCCYFFFFMRAFLYIFLIPKDVQRNKVTFNYHVFCHWYQHTLWTTSAFSMLLPKRVGSPAGWAPPPPPTTDCFLVSPAGWGEVAWVVVDVGGTRLFLPRWRWRNVVTSICRDIVFRCLGK